MKLTPAERLILDNQRAIMWALAYPGESKTVLLPRVELTGAATIIKKAQAEAKA